MAYTTAQRLDSSTDEAMEQAERVRALIESGGVLPPTTPPSTLPDVAEAEDDFDDDAAADRYQPMAAASAAGATTTLSPGTISTAASKAAKAASAAAANAAALSSPRRGAGGGNEVSGEMPALVPAGGGRGNKTVTNVWGQLGGSERDSDCMSADTSFSAQGLLPADLRCVTDA